MVEAKRQAKPPARTIPHAEAPPPPLGWLRWGIALAAVTIGASSSLVLEYQKTGTIDPGNAATAAVVFVSGIATIGLVVWFGAQASRKEDEPEQE